MLFVDVVRSMDAYCANFLYPFCITHAQGDLSENKRKIMQYAHHTIAKMIVSTNPSLLTTSQRMGSVQLLLALVKDSDSSDLATFEALLSLTNLASCNDSTSLRHVPKS